MDGFKCVKANHVRGYYRIATGFVVDRPFAHIGKIYFSMILYRTGVRTLSMVIRNYMIQYDSAYYTRVNTFIVMKIMMESKFPKDKFKTKSPKINRGTCNALKLS